MAIGVASVRRFDNREGFVLTRAPNVVRLGERMRKIEIKAYLSSQSCGQMFSKTATVWAYAGGGAVVGAGIGSRQGVVGAAAGAAIGAVVGVALRLASVSTWTSNEFKNWKERQPQAVVTATLAAIKEKVRDPELICPITKEPPGNPAVTPFSDQVCELAALEDYVRVHSKCPITDGWMTVDDIRHAPAAMGALYLICHEITHSEEGREFSPEQKKGVEMLEKDIDTHRRAYLVAEEKYLMRRVQDGEISIRYAGDRFQRMYQTIDPQNVDEIILKR